MNPSTRWVCRTPSLSGHADDPRPAPGLHLQHQVRALQRRHRSARDLRRGRRPRVCDARSEVRTLRHPGADRVRQGGGEGPPGAGQPARPAVRRQAGDRQERPPLQLHGQLLRPSALLPGIAVAAAVRLRRRLLGAAPPRRQAARPGQAGQGQGDLHRARLDRGLGRRAGRAGQQLPDLRAALPRVRRPHHRVRLQPGPRAGQPAEQRHRQGPRPQAAAALARADPPRAG